MGVPPWDKKEPSGCKLPGVRLLAKIIMTEKVKTRVNTMTPFTNICIGRHVEGHTLVLQHDGQN